MLNGWLVVTAKQGTLQVEGAGHKAQVAEGKTLTLPIKTAQSQGSSAGSGSKSGVSKVEWAGLVASATGAVLSGCRHFALQRRLPCSFGCQLGGHPRRE